MRALALLSLLLLGCTDDVSSLSDAAPADAGPTTDASPRKDAQIADAGALPDSAVAPDAETMDDAGFDDGGTDPDAGGSIDGGMSGDAGTVPCAQLQRDVCIVTPGCVLDGSENNDPGYFCRDAASPCEQLKDPTECQGDPRCTYLPGGCYCPENQVCACGGGPAPVCREICGGLAGTPCPSGFFCDLPNIAPGPVCPGNPDQLGTCVPVPPTCAGALGGPVCGCVNDITPTDFANDCERRAARASLGQPGACP